MKMVKTSPCWKGYRRNPSKRLYSSGSCVKVKRKGGKRGKRRRRK